MVGGTGTDVSVDCAKIFVGVDNVDISDGEIKVCVDVGGIILVSGITAGADG